jgi:hypothetical protein
MKPSRERDIVPGYSSQTMRNRLHQVVQYGRDEGDMESTTQSLYRML